MSNNHNDELKVGDRVAWNPKYLFGIITKTGTIVGLVKDTYVIDWDESQEYTYTTHINGALYFNIYCLPKTKVKKLIEPLELQTPNPLPDDPRLMGICLKIRHLEHRFKVRHQDPEYHNKERTLSDFQRSSLCTN